MKNIVRLCLSTWLCLLASPLQAQEDAPYKSKPKNHEKNQQLAASAYERNLKKHAEVEHMLVLPGLVADKKIKRVEVMVERTAVGQNAPCEFTIIAGTNEAAVRLEKLLVDRRTGQTLPEEGFLFTGSRMVPASNDPQRKVHAADPQEPTSQPMNI